MWFRDEANQRFINVNQSLQIWKESKRRVSFRNLLANFICHQMKKVDIQKFNDSSDSFIIKRVRSLHFFIFLSTNSVMNIN